MPKVVRAAVGRQSRSGPISLESAIKRDTEVRRKSRQKVRFGGGVGGEEEDEEGNAEEGRLEANGRLAANDRLAAKVEELSRGMVLDEEYEGLLEVTEEYPPLDATLETDEFAYPVEEDLNAVLGPSSSVRVVGNEDSTAGSEYSGRTIGDLIFAKMQEKSRAEAEAEKMALFNESTKKLFADVGDYMSHYRVGKLPKALRFIPNLKNWLDVLWLTQPERWTPHGVAAVTPMFVNGVGEGDSQKYMSYVLLPAVLQDIQKFDRLNVHLFEALGKCLYKPAAFFKAIYFPVILDSKCNYKQAVILNSVVAKQSVPAVHVAAALIKLCKHEPPTNQLYYSMLRLINKKNNLPLAAVRVVAAYFISYMTKTDQIPPVIWQQAFLVFVQRWKTELNHNELEAIKKLIKVHHHTKITMEIRRELNYLSHDNHQDIAMT
ncbi:bystin [Gregarina niphandrodes]|uniref:Bystin n=1 Tax=Gregarina niphandrodes TaxID=110365 RepID=A0A023B3D2_GRENI|nr:bystin [Gregarina niphandrodes]EZG55422.1 bystin [Gregarina niphandrodes]|eukprot:XP_011131562.1 bystin [Gregarina niphandrodes]